MYKLSEGRHMNIFVSDMNKIDHNIGKYLFIHHKRNVDVVTLAQGTTSELLGSHMFQRLNIDPVFTQKLHWGASALPP